MIDLAAMVWKLNIPDAVRRLGEIGCLPPPTDRFDERLRSHLVTVQKRQLHQQFWQRSQHTFFVANTADLRDLQCQLGVKAIRDWSYNGPWRPLIGGTSVVEIESALVEPSRFSATGGVIRGSNNFTGTGWSALLVFPFWALPGLLTGFLCAGRDLNRSQDYVYLPLYQPNQHQPVYDAGVALLPVVTLPPHPVLHDNLIVFDDPVLATRIQLRHLREYDCPLPLISIYRRDKQLRTSSHIWNWLRRRTVFWGPREPTFALHHACSSKSRYSHAKAGDSVLGATGKGVLCSDNLRPLDWMSKIVRLSKGWNLSLADRLLKLNDQEAVNWLASLRLTGQECQTFIADCTPTLRERLQRLYSAKASLRQVRLGKCDVHETNGGWYTNRNCISNAVVRIEQILQSSDGSQYYRGEILYQDQTVPFTDKATNMQSQLLSWACRWLSQAGYPGMQFSPSWDARGIQIAIALHAPHVVTDGDQYGWNQHQHQFNFGDFSLVLGGDVVQHATVPLPKLSMSEPVLDTPAKLSPFEVKQLSKRSHEQSLFWATVSYLAANLLAPAIHRERGGLLLDGAGAQQLGRDLLLSVQCAEWQRALRNDYPRFNTEVTQYLTRYPNWPFLVQTNKPWRELDDWLNSRRTHCPVVLPNYAACRAMGTRGWAILRCDRKVGPLQPELQQTARRCVSAYLHDLCSRQLELPHTTCHLLTDVLTDVARWFREHYSGDVRGLYGAFDMLELPGQFPIYKHFLDLVFRFINTGHLQWRRAEFVTTQETAIATYDETQRVVWLPEETITRTWEQSAKTLPTLATIDASLHDTGALVDRRVFVDSPGWLLQADWFSREHAAWQARMRKIGGDLTCRD